MRRRGRIQVRNQFVRTRTCGAGITLSACRHPLKLIQNTYAHRGSILVRRQFARTRTCGASITLHLRARTRSCIPRISMITREPTDPQLQREEAWTRPAAQIEMVTTLTTSSIIRGGVLGTDGRAGLRELENSGHARWAHHLVGLVAAIHALRRRHLQGVLGSYVLPRNRGSTGGREEGEGAVQPVQFSKSSNNLRLSKLLTRPISLLTRFHARQRNL